MANSYRMTVAEFLFFARRMSLTILPRWFASYDAAAGSEADEEEGINAALLQKEFLIRQEGELLPHPLMAYLFMEMAGAEMWMMFGEEAFLYLSEQTPVLLEKNQRIPGQLRVIPLEDRRACWEYLRECAYVHEAAAAYGGEHPEAAQTIISEMENYLEQ